MTVSAFGVEHSGISKSDKITSIKDGIRAGRTLKFADLSTRGIKVQSKNVKDPGVRAEAAELLSDIKQGRKDVKDQLGGLARPAAHFVRRGDRYAAGGAATAVGGGGYAIGRKKRKKD